jgi:sugar phosphate isomerase/epimerase
MSKLKLSFEVWPNMPWGRLDNCGPAFNTWGDKPLDWCVGKIGEYGYEGFDVVYPKIMEIQPSDKEDQIQKIKSSMSKHNLAFASIACHTTFVSPRYFDRDNGIEKFKNAIDDAAKMGAETVVTLVGDGYYDPPLYNLITRKEAWEQVIKATREVADYAKQYNIDVSIELLQGTIINDVPSMLKLLEIVDRSNVYCCVDVGTFYTTVKPKMPIKEAIKKLGDRIKVVHVKDEVGFPNIIQSQHVWLGGGFVDFVEMAEALKEVNYKDFNSVEWEGWQAGGLFGVGEPSGIGLTDFDRVAEESKEFLEENGWGK